MSSNISCDHPGCDSLESLVTVMRDEGVEDSTRNTSNLMVRFMLAGAFQ